jgi:hypothetical protein
MLTVRVAESEPFGNLLLGQLEGYCELAAAFQYSIQRINCENMAFWP